MQKTSSHSVVILLICSTIYQSFFVSGISESRAKQDIKVSNIINSIGNLPESIKKSSSEISEFSKEVAEFGAKYVIKKVHLNIKYLLFTPTQPYDSYYLEISEKSLQESTFDPSLDTKFLIHGLGTKLRNSSVFFEIKNELLKIGDFNIIVVNWTDYNGLPYSKASLNAVFVGFEIGKLIQLLINSEEISPNSVHLIGHSLGGQSAGFAGKTVRGIGRISGLDAAGPIFQDLLDSQRLTFMDADIVDAIHTNGASSVLQGFGALDPYADIDFFPNSGSSQPNCSFGDTYLNTDNKSHTILDPVSVNTCSHDRVLWLFLYSINRCKFDSVNCNSYQDFLDGKCFKETSIVSRMGFYSTPVETPPPYYMFYLNTTGASPYCTKK